MADRSIDHKTAYYEWIDYAKGIGIVLVVYGHVARGIINSGMILDKSLFERIDNIIYSFHMPLFFFLSGIFFVNSYTKRGFKGLVLTKIDTLIYPYLVWSIIHGLISYPFNGLANSAIALNDIYSILWRPYDHFWFLYSLFLTFIIYSIIYKLTKSISIVFIISLIAYFMQDYFSIPWSIFKSVMRFGVFFSVGMLGLSYIKLPEKNIVLWGVAGVVIFSASQWYFLNAVGPQYDKYIKLILLMAAILSIVSVILLSLVFQRFNVTIIRNIGKYTLEIYLAHIIFQSGFRIIAHHFFNVDSVPIHLIVGSLVGIFCPILLVFVLRKLDLSFLFYLPEKYRFEYLSAKA